MLGILNLEVDFAVGDGLTVLTTVKSKKAFFRRMIKAFKAKAHQIEEQHSDDPVAISELLYGLDRDLESFYYSIKYMQMITVDQKCIDEYKRSKTKNI